MRTEISTQLLDNPTWNALNTHRAAFSEGGELARRFRPEIGPLAGLKEQSSEAYAELGRLLAPGEFAALFLDSEPALPSGWKLLLHKSGDQMVYEGSRVSPDRHFQIETLGEQDIPEMLALTALTDPGPFRDRTIDLGGFLGIREGGRLAAMAGQRLSLPGFREVSAVCTHPDFRKRGYGKSLVTTVMAAIQEDGETPILHTFSSNVSAIRVYEALGFVLRRRLDIALVALDVVQV